MRTGKPRKSDMQTTQQRSEFDSLTVRGVVAIFKEYAKARDLGPPPEIVTNNEMMSCGIAVKWNDATGHGVLLDKSAPNIEATVKEIVRRVKDWQQEGVTP